MTTTPGLPLEGIMVVSMEQAVAAPFATRQLADLGARVIKVERAGVGDFARGYDETVRGLSSHFVWLNRGKESLTLDVKSPNDLALLHNILEQADVFVQNLAPGAADRLGLGHQALRSSYPRLVSCGISGYGTSGPYRDKKAYDLLVQSEAGLLSITGTAAEPAKAGISIADIAAAMYTYSGVLTALYEREHTGRGNSFDVSMLDALGEWMGFPFYYEEYGEIQPRRTGARHAVISPYGPYTVGDGQQIFIGVQNEREWATLCAEVLDAPELAADERFCRNSRRVENDGELTILIERALCNDTAEEVIARMDAAGVATARMRSIKEFADHPQLAARNRWRDIQTPVGTVKALLPPVEWADREPRMEAVPALGEHNPAIHREFIHPNLQGRDWESARS